MPARRISYPVAEPFCLASAKAHLRVDFDDENEYIEALISVVREAVEDRTGRTMIATDYRLAVDSFSDFIEIPSPPCIAVKSIKYFDVSGAECTLAPSSYIVDAVSEPARIYPSGGGAWPAVQGRINAVWVEYTAGYGDTADAVPRPLIHWMKLAMTDLYDSRGRSAERPQVPQKFADGLLDTYRIWGC